MDDCRSCQGVTERMTRYVDGALPGNEREAVERHLRACPPCRREAETEAACRTVLRDCAARLRGASVPPALRARCEAAARAHARSRAGAWRARVLPIVIAASLVLATVVAITRVAARRSTTLLAAQLAGDHASCFSRVPAEAPPLTAAAVAEHLQQRYGWDVHVPAAEAVAGLQLVEGRRCLVATHGGVPHLLYRVNGEELSLFVFPGETRQSADVMTADGRRAQVWSRGGNSFALISSSSPAAAPALDYVRQDAH